LPDREQTGRGLTTDEAAARRGRFGANDIIVAPPSNWLSTLSDTLRDPMIWFLVIVSVLFVAIGDYSEAAILAVAVVPLVGMDLYLHRRTQASTQGLASRLASQAAVIRNGNTVTMSAREIVPGDLVEVASGAPFPADGLFVFGNDLQVDESSLTGEAYPVRKQPIDPAAARLSSVDLAHWAFAGTRLLTGSARVRIVSTGGETLYGEIVRSALTGNHASTPLQIAVRRLVAIMLVAALFLCAGLAATRLIQGHGPVDAFLSALTLAIAALPEEFPVVFTFFLGVGVYRLARRRALVRRSVAVENIGRVSCICSDKTGTLTEGRLALAHRIPAADTSPEQLVYWAAAASRCDSGDPLDGALTDAAPEAIAIERLAAFPFTEDRRRETAIIRLADGARMAVVKGAPETVFERCDMIAPSPETWRAHVATYASSGHKVIAAATKLLAPADSTESEPQGGYLLAGLIALEDPVREGVQEAIAACRQAGIRVIMVTGDHPTTAEAIAREIGLGAGQPVVVLAEALDFAGTGGGLEALEQIDVVARATPSQKVELVRALQRSGEIVAVTGDGVNDVPALQTADIGIAMGERGTQSAREVASVVLLDDNFRTIVRAIAEGRQLFLNLQLAFTYLLLVHIPLVVSAAIVPLFDNPLLYLPIHIIWLELIIHPTALLVFQEMPTSDRLLPTRRGGPTRFFGLRTWALIGISGLAQAAIISIGFELVLGTGNDVEHARSMALGILIGSSAAMTVALGRLQGWAARLVVAGSLASLVLLVQVPFLAELVHLKPLHLADWGMVAVAVLVAGLLALAVKAGIDRDQIANQIRTKGRDHVQINTRTH
jgi:Ca2+-transporting ATPase